MARDGGVGRAAPRVRLDHAPGTRSRPGWRARSPCIAAGSLADGVTLTAEYGAPLGRRGRAGRHRGPHRRRARPVVADPARSTPPPGADVVRLVAVDASGSDQRLAGVLRARRRPAGAARRLPAARRTRRAGLAAGVRLALPAPARDRQRDHRAGRVRGAVGREGRALGLLGRRVAGLPRAARSRRSRARSRCWSWPPCSRPTRTCRWPCSAAPSGRDRYTLTEDRRTVAGASTATGPRHRRLSRTAPLMVGRCSRPRGRRPPGRYPGTRGDSWAGRGSCSPSACCPRWPLSRSRSPRCASPRSPTPGRPRRHRRRPAAHAVPAGRSSPRPIGCAAARSGGLLLSTVPPRPDPTALPLDGLRAGRHARGVQVTSAGVDLGTVPLPPGRLHARARLRRRRHRRRARRRARAEPRPATSAPTSPGSSPTCPRPPTGDSAAVR